jgi:hypothetical protein
VLFHFDRSYDSAYAAKLRSLLEKLVTATVDQDSDPFAVVRDAMRDEAIAAASKAFRLQPGAFGVSIDLRTGWSALKQYLRDRGSQND